MFGTYESECLNMGNPRLYDSIPIIYASYYFALLVASYYFACSPEGRPGISDVSPLSGVSGLSVLSHFSISPLVLLASPVALSILSFSDFGRFS